MLLITLLNSVYKLQSFIYTKVDSQTRDDQDCLIVKVEPRKNSKAKCSHCGHSASCYDKLQERLFEFVPIWGIKVFLSYQMRRVQCKNCGVKVEQVPWSQGKLRNTDAFELFILEWAKKMPVKDVATTFGLHWNTVYEIIKDQVSEALENRDLTNIEAIGVDEICTGKGHSYTTLVYQIEPNNKRLLYMAEERKTESLEAFFDLISDETRDSIKYVCSDMWKPYIKVIDEQLINATHVLDRFHVVKLINKAVDEVRREERRELKENGYEDILNNTRYCFLKNPENLTRNQELKLNDILKYDLRSVKAYLLKEAFQALWQYNSPYWAKWYLEKWCKRAMLSRLDPIKKFVKTVRKYQDKIINYFHGEKKYSSGTVEGFNRKLNVITRKSYGFRSYEVWKTMAFFQLGALEFKKTTHRFV